MPLVRWQYRGLKEEERRAFLFTNLTDGRGRSYDGMSVAVAALGASRQVYAAALGWSSSTSRPARCSSS